MLFLIELKQYGVKLCRLRWKIIVLTKKVYDFLSEWIKATTIPWLKSPVAKISLT